MKKLLALAFALMLIFSVALADEPLTIAVSMRSTAVRCRRRVVCSLPAGRHCCRAGAPLRRQR